MALEKRLAQALQRAHRAMTLTLPRPRSPRLKIAVASVVLASAASCSQSDSPSGLVNDAQHISTADSGPCVPTTCASANAQCGEVSDGCGGTLSCGACPAFQACGADGISNHCALECPSGGAGQPYSPYKSAFFGNLHQHTGYSLDANTFGTRVLPSDSYQFAKGLESIDAGTGTTDPPGPRISLNRPLDFLAVTDHSEWMGIVEGCDFDPDSGFYGAGACGWVRSTNHDAQSYVFASIRNFYEKLCDGGSTSREECAAEQRNIWEEEQTDAINAYEPCQFTSLIGYEWTSTPNGDTHHRNVIFGSTQVPVNPLDSEVYSTLSELFSGLDAQCDAGCSALVIPHNSNLSNGTSLVLPSSSSELNQMEKYQRLVEVYQHKGNSECYWDAGGGTDPECNFEYLSNSNDTPANYVRSALEAGLTYALDGGTTNPLKVGIISSTDDHNGAAGYVDENSYIGHVGRLDDQPSLRLAGTTSPQYGSGGLAVVWAEQNTRAAIFAALQRKETYGTSGPRMQVRFYQTWNTSPCTSDFPQTIINEGAALPMGSSFRLADLDGGRVPTFAVGAWADEASQSLADGTEGVAQLAKVEIIKASAQLQADGGVTMTESAPVAVYDGAGTTGGCWSWKDRSFQPSGLAFYYVRVLQVPTWRWSHFDCLDAGASVAGCQPDGGLDVAIQERAWTSPIWYVH
jgi:hypothetical protein